MQVRDNKAVATPSREMFGVLPDGKSVDLISLAGAGGLRMSAMTYGCTIVSLSVPDRESRHANVILGFDRLDGYLADSRYFGAVAGRYANRIANAQFLIDGRTYNVSANEPPNHLHGGGKGFDKCVWDAETHDNGRGVIFRRVSPDGEEGYPGTLAVSVSYVLTDRNELHVQYDAETDTPTHVNLTQHSYFNLRGDGRGDVLDHRLQVSADSYLPVTAEMIPTGEVAPVTNTPFDFREPAAIGARAGGAYDHTLILATGTGLSARAARVFEPSTGRTMEVRTTEPGLQVYSGGDHRGLCLETQHYPDSPNRPEFPSTILRPGQRYHSRTEFAFGIG